MPGVLVFADQALAINRPSGERRERASQRAGVNFGVCKHRSLRVVLRTRNRRATGCRWWHQLVAGINQPSHANAHKQREIIASEAAQYRSSRMPRHHRVRAEGHCLYRIAHRLHICVRNEIKRLIKPRIARCYAGIISPQQRASAADANRTSLVQHTMREIFTSCAICMTIGIESSIEYD